MVYGLIIQRWFDGLITGRVSNDCSILTDTHLDFFPNFHSPHLEPSKDLHTKNLLASKVLTVRSFRCTRFFLWAPHQPTVRYALTIFFSQHIYCHFSLAALSRQCLQALIAIDLGQNAQCEIEHFGKTTSTRTSQRTFNPHTFAQKNKYMHPYIYI